MTKVSVARLAALTLSSLALIASGCDDRELVPLDAGLDTGMDTGTMDAGLDGAVSPADRLQGLWTGACVVGAEEDGGVSESARQGFAFSGDQFVTRIERYFDGSCATAIVRVELAGTFSVGEPVSTVVNGFELDFAIDTMTAHLLDADFEDVANAERFLGFTDWDADTTKDVTGVDVFGNNNPLNADSVIYQIFQIALATDGSVALPVLLLGDEGSAGPVQVEANRPTTLSNAAHIFTGPARN